jgi:hypothetical protein
VADLLAWCLHSPRRLLGVVVVALAVLVGVIGVLQTGRSDARPGPRASTSVAGALPDTGPAVGAAVTFTRAWASKPAGSSAEQWRQQLTALVTPDLARGLAATDPASLPGGQPHGTPTLRFVSTASCLVEVPLSSGRSVLVTVVLSDADGHWLVSDVQPATGNLGDVGGSSVGSGSASSGSAGSG